jgi:hypothetical protein
MSSVVISGDTSGSITLQAPAVAGSNTLTLPASTGTIITTASSGQSIPKAALPTGSVLQVVQTTYTTNGSTSATTPVDTGLSASITPLSSSNKILILVSQPIEIYNNQTNVIQANLNICRGSTVVITYGSCSYTQVGVGGNGFQDTQSTVFMQYLDSPATTSSTTYKTQCYLSTLSTGAYGVRWQTVGTNNTCVASITLMEIAA